METDRNEEDLKTDSKIEGVSGAINACKQCSGLFCCGRVLSEDGIIEPPYLTKHDLREIEFRTGLHISQFANEKKNPVTKQTIYTMQTSAKSGCVFFNGNSGRCQIYKYRPMDCRLFPLDIELIDEKYYWALFKYSRCKMKEKDMQSLLKYKDEALQILGDELKNYATYPVPRMRKIGYKILTEVEI